ncbi:MAG TPA: hypothetical protein VF951_00500 [Streptosporangiaceae bacterium]
MAPRRQSKGLETVLELESHHDPKQAGWTGPGAEKFAEQGRRAAGLVQFGCGELATRLEVAEQGSPSRDRVDVS